MIWFVACPVTLLWFQDYNTSNKIPHPGCSQSSYTGEAPSLPFIISCVHRAPSMNLPASIHVCSHSCSCNGEISTSHTAWTLSHLHTYSAHTHTRALQHACFSLIVLFFLGAPVSGWHHDHGCHASRSVFSKTAEDSLAHVTTASRLTCYHGDKPANENSADSCDVDYELFVLRGDLFFFPSPLPPAQTLLLSARALRRLRT